jgi:hypothetical protein
MAIRAPESVARSGAYSDPSRADELLERWQFEYDDCQMPLVVDFPSAVDWIPRGERATHLIHPYPAKLLRQIPALFASSTKYTQPGNTIFDPFMGSGTVLLEALLAGRNAAGIDTNPLAVLISSVKSTPLSPDRLEAYLIDITTAADHGDLDTRAPNVNNADYWYAPTIHAALCRLRAAVSTIASEDHRRFFELALSHCARRVSKASPHFSVPVLHKPERFPERHPMRTWRHPASDLKEVLTEFRRIAKLNICRMRQLTRTELDVTATVAEGDARGLQTTQPADALYDMVITSPPYVGAQKYIRASSLSLGWLGYLDRQRLRAYELRTIGREHLVAPEYQSLLLTGDREADRLLTVAWERNPVRGAIAATYLREMSSAVKGIVARLRPGGFMVVVLGANSVCGHPFPTPQFVDHISRTAGLELRLHLVDAIRSRSLMTRRNATAGQIGVEEIRLYHKPGQ